MARTKTELSAGARLADYLTVGFLAMQCPVGKVRQTLEKNGAQSQRRRGLPHEVLVYFVMMMVLYADVAYEDVMRLVVEGPPRARIKCDTYLQPFRVQGRNYISWQIQ